MVLTVVVVLYTLVVSCAYSICVIQVGNMLQYFGGCFWWVFIDTCIGDAVCTGFVGEAFVFVHL